MTQEKNTETAALSMENVKVIPRDAQRTGTSANQNTLQLYQHIESKTWWTNTSSHWQQQQIEGNLRRNASLNVYEDKLNKLEKIIEFENEKNRTELEKVW